MNDPFTDVADELMSRSTDLGASAEPSAPLPSIGNAKTKKHVCPYCGAVTAVAEKPTGPCPKCNMEDTPATRAATKARIGPWYVLQNRNPSAPGMKWATLLSLVSKGQVTPRSVVRGPTTHQLWKFAAHVKGLSREFNLCYSCGAEVERTANQCPQCDRLQEPPVNPDALLESRDMTPRVAIQREIKPALAGPLPTDLVVSGPSAQAEDLSHPRVREEGIREDGILSAKELATAFQLDFNPQSSDAPMGSTERRKRSPLKVFAILILLGLITGGALLYVNPGYREKAYAWATSTVASIKSSVSSNKPASKMMWDSSQQPKADEPTPQPAPQPAADQTPPANSTPTDAQTSPQPSAATPAAADNPQPVANNTPTPAPQPEIAQAPQPTPTPVAETHVAPAPKEKEEVAIKPSAPPPPAPQPTAQQTLQDKLKADLEAPIPADLDAQRTLGKRLWEGAIDLESQLDYSLSIPCYEKLKQLDPSARPSNDGTIDMRIKVAKAQVAGQ